MSGGMEVAYAKQKQEEAQKRKREQELKEKQKQRMLDTLHRRLGEMEMAVDDLRELIRKERKI